MEILTLTKPVYNKNQYEKVIDTSFNQLGLTIPPPTSIAPDISVAEFFVNYQQIFFTIPKLGETNSHEYLAITSQEYIGSNTITDSTILALIEEVTQLRQENLDLQQQLTLGNI